MGGSVGVGVGTAEGVQASGTASSDTIASGAARSSPRSLRIFASPPVCVDYIPWNVALQTPTLLLMATSGAGAEFQSVRATLAARAREIRRRRRLSQEALSDLAGCDRTYIGMIERSIGNPSLRILASIAYALEVRTQELLEERKVENPGATDLGEYT